MGMRVPVLVLYAVGLLAGLGSWVAHALGLSPHRSHSDLWFAVGVFAVGLLTDGWSAGRRQGALRMLFGLLAMGVTAANLPRLVQTTQRTGAVGELLAEGARQWLVAYAVVALAGLGLAAIGALGLRSPGTNAERAGLSG